MFVTILLPFRLLNNEAYSIPNDAFGNAEVVINHNTQVGASDTIVELAKSIKRKFGYPDNIDTLSFAYLLDYAKTLCDDYGVPFEIFLGKIKTESYFIWDEYEITNWFGAAGFSQVTPICVEEVNIQFGTEYTFEDVCSDPYANLAVGIMFLGYLIDSYGNVQKALVYYNEGSGNVAKKGIEDWNNHKYVRKVYSFVNNLDSYAAI